MSATFYFPRYPQYAPLFTRLLIDTGTDHVVYAPTRQTLRVLEDRYSFDLSALPAGPRGEGPTGSGSVRLLHAVITMRDYEKPLEIRIIEPRYDREPSQQFPALMGRTVLHDFALFLEAKRSRAFLLTPGEADGLGLST